MHASLQADAFNPAPQLDTAAPAEASPSVPPVPAAPIEPASRAPTEPADAGDIAQGHVLTTREERRKVRDLLFASSTAQF